MTRVQREEQEGAGFDSFLDIIANLVGILIILVVVIGAQVSSQWSKAPTAEELETTARVESLKQSLADEERVANKLEIDNTQLVQRAEQEKALSELAEAERDRVQQLVVLAEREIEEKLAALDQTQKQRVEAQTQLASYEAEKSRLIDELRFVQSQESKPNILQHHATPLAQTVFNDEVHFRLKSGRLAYVPMEELIREMSSQLRFQAEKLRNAAGTIETVGPIDQFRMRYVLQVKEQLIRTEVGVLRREVPEFVGFILLPAREVMGEEVANAINDPNSDLRRRLSRFDAEKTTVTIWVYPDSYEEYLELENWLHQQQFLVASWPLPEGQPIAGGPNGFRSVAQ